MFTFLGWIDTKPLWVRVVVHLAIGAYLVVYGLREHPTGWFWVVVGSLILLDTLDEPRRDAKAKARRAEGGDDASG